MPVFLTAIIGRAVGNAAIQMMVVIVMMGVDRERFRRCRTKQSGVFRIRADIVGHT
jgi:hypothetical protein